MNLSSDELLRYSRQIALPEFGLEGQQRLKNSSALVVGAGGLGCPAALYLAAAGIGRLGIVDADQVDLSNLHRQILHSTESVGHRKVDSAGRSLAAMAPHTRYELHAERFSADNAQNLVSRYDLVIDGSDNFSTRYLVNDACVLFGKPLVHGSVFRFDGMVTIFAAAGGPCYRCLFPEMPPPDQIPNCAEGGVLGAVPGLVGVLQATEAIKLLIGLGSTLVGRLLTVDLLSMRFGEHRLARDPGCPVCGDSPSITTLRSEESGCGVSQIKEEIDAPTAAALYRGASPPVLLDVREPWELAIASLPGAISIPLRSLPARIGELDPAQRHIVIYHHGMRSERAADLLRQAGFPAVSNLAGGIDAWSRLVDGRVPRY